MEYSIVIPAYNEADKITSSLTQVVSFMRNFSESFEVIVVDDGSEDNTATIVFEYKKENPEVILIKNPHKGKGFSVWTGFGRAKGDYIYMCDADLSAPIAELKKLGIWVKEQDYDIVLASRQGFGSERVDEPFYRHLMGRVFNFLVQLVALPGIQDSQCGFKLFRKDAAKDIFSRLSVRDAKEISVPYTGAWDVEVLYLARKLGYSIKDIPVRWTHVKTSGVHPIRDSIKMTFEVFKVRINDLRGYYKTAQSTSK